MSAESDRRRKVRAAENKLLRLAREKDRADARASEKRQQVRGAIAECDRLGVQRSRIAELAGVHRSYVGEVLPKKGKK